MIYEFTFDELSTLEIALGKMTAARTEYPAADSIRISEDGCTVNVQLRHIPSGCIAAASCDSGILIASDSTSERALRTLKALVSNDLRRRATEELEQA